eukprot:COSAG02_NODE_51726_length_312_cov_0.793427_1_plen_53_part_10
MGALVAPDGRQAIDLAGIWWLGTESSSSGRARCDEGGRTGRVASLFLSAAIWP